MYELVGYRHVDFTDAKGVRVEGFSLYVSYVKDGVTGLATDKIFVRPGLMPSASSLKPGIPLDIRFNRFGKVEAVILGQ